MQSNERDTKEQAAVSQGAPTNKNVAPAEDVFAKQEKLFTGGTSEMPS